MTVFIAIVRLALAAVFVVSAVAKIRDRDGSRGAVVAFGVPTTLAGPIAFALPVVELLCAGLLVLGDPFATAGALASLLLLAVFTGAIVVNLRQGKRPQCHCFGSLGGQTAISWSTVWRNIGLMVLAGTSLLGPAPKPSVPEALTDLASGQGLVAVGFAVLLAAVLGLSLGLRALVTRYGTVLLRLEALERAAGIAEPLPAPDFRLANLRGEEVTLDDVLARGRPLLLTFISPSCHNCTDLIPDLSAWQGDAHHDLEVVVVSDGSIADNRTKLAGSPDLDVLLQQGNEASTAYGILGTPGAVLVGVDGLLAGVPVHGADGVRGLHERTIQTIRGGGPSAHGHPGEDAQVHSVGRRPVEVGDVVPELELRGEDGAEVRIDSGGDGDVTLLFWRDTCSYCRGILEQVRALEPHVDVRLVTESPADAIRASGLESAIVRDGGGALQGWLQIPGTPSAVRVRNGALVSQVAVGGPAVLEVLRADQGATALAQP